MDQYIGRLLDNRYEILEIIGTGGMAVVYKARCHRLNRLVAIKILKDEFARDDEFRRRFHAEGEAVAMLSHPNIVQVYDVSSTDQANFIVMEMIDGISLKQYMEKKGVLNWKETLHFAMLIAKGLDHAHGRGIVHRDIKPHNVMVLKNGSVKVMDFGIARVMSKSNTLTKEALGSVHYISPEQAKGGHTDNRSDIYSLGVVMYEMMAGRPPYDGESPVAVAIQHINGGAPMPSAFNPNIPGGMEQIIMKAMALELKDRYVSAGEMLQDLEEFRKNPAILFPYRRVTDDATRPIAVIPPSKRKTTAERVAQSKSAAPRPRTGQDSAGIRPTGATQNSVRLRQTEVISTAGAIKKRTTGPVSGAAAGASAARSRNTGAVRRGPHQLEKGKETARKHKESSRITTMTTAAIMICSAVAVVAIIVFIIALMNGYLLNQERDYVKVPYLVGDMYNEDLALEYSDFVFKLRPQQYNDEYQKGQIMDMEPIGGSNVVAGTEVWLTVSLGEEPLVKVMENIVGVTEEVATTFLEGQGFKALPWYESSDEYEMGTVIRTDPEADTELTEGQTIKLFISTGPAIKVERMPNVVGSDQEQATLTLEQYGFFNYKTEPVESQEPKGQVVRQSELANVEIDVTTAITLYISEGPAPTTAPPTTDPPTEETTEETTEATTEATTEPEELPEVTKSVTFILPERAEAYILKIYLDGGAVTEGIQIQPGITSYAMQLTGSGSQSYDLYIDDVFYQTVKVDFAANG